MAETVSAETRELIETTSLWLDEQILDAADEMCGRDGLTPKRALAFQCAVLQRTLERLGARVCRMQAEGRS